MPKRTNKKGAGPPKKLSKSDPDFYRKIGRKGGKANKANHSSDYFSSLAIHSHNERRRKRSEAASLPQEPGAES